ncbi:hypothetical protein [Gemmatimonas sp.]|uniref:hypothetical protein n=1 Tax=Gemmatimonas sp. TaxID=1962908 RepID=UPI00286B204B|nr:hypothetical protein [Gemmatimonas sp.]
MNIRASLRFLAFAALCAGCHANDATAPSAGQVSILVRSVSGPTSATSLQLEIINASEAALGYNLCTNGRLDRLRAGQWELVDMSGRACTLELRVLAGNARADEGYRLPSTIDAGTYRLVVHFSVESTGGGRVSASTDPFVVP